MVTNDKSKGKVEEDSDLPRDFTVENVATGETINIENVQTVSEIELDVEEKENMDSYPQYDLDDKVDFTKINVNEDTKKEKEKTKELDRYVNPYINESSKKYAAANCDKLIRNNYTLKLFNIFFRLRLHTESEYEMYRKKIMDFAEEATKKSIQFKDKSEQEQRDYTEEISKKIQQMQFEMFYLNPLKDFDELPIRFKRSLIETAVFFQQYDCIPL